MDDSPLHSAGLRFSCARCSGCCRHDGGFVFLSERDLEGLVEAFGMELAHFINMWCRWVPHGGGRERLSLREKPNMDCVFWSGDVPGGGGCSVYGARPLQCSAFPFWDSIVCSREAWDRMAKDCPGMNSGELRPRGEIDGLLRRIEGEPVVERDAPAAAFGGARGA